MDRQEWQKWENPNNGWINRDLFEIIKSSCEDCNLDFNLHIENYINNFYKVRGLKQYNLISFGVADPMRISAFPVSYFYNEAWNINSVEPIPSFNYMWSNTNITDRHRNEKGLFVKVGKIVSALGLGGTNSCLCASIAEKIRLRADVDLSALQVSEDVSGVYTKAHSSRGNIGSSCMRGMNSGMFEIYDDIGCKILYLEQGDYLVGRALLHDNVHNVDGDCYKLMDRVYFDAERTKAMFYGWAKENGYIRKAEQSAGCNDYIRPDGTEFSDNYGDTYLQFDFSLEDRYDEVPYVDTFAYYDGGRCRLYAYWVDGVCTSLKEADGTDSEGILTEGRGETCCCCSERDSDGRWHNDEFYCDSCFHDNYFLCYHCDEYEPRQDSIFTYSQDYICRHCYEDSYFTCSECGEVFSDADNPGDNICQECFDKNYFTCESCGGTCHNNEAEVDNVCRNCCTECSECGEYHLTGALISSEIGDICRDCLVSSFKQCHCGEMSRLVIADCECGFVFELEEAV